MDQKEGNEDFIGISFQFINRFQGLGRSHKTDLEALPFGYLDFDCGNSVDSPRDRIVSLTCFMVPQDCSTYERTLL